MSARVAVTRPEPSLDVSPLLPELADEIASVWSLAPDAPHHFVAASDHAGIDAAITAYARESLAGRPLGAGDGRASLRPHPQRFRL